MDQKRLLLAITLSLAILVVFQVVIDKFLPHPAPAPAQVSGPASAPAPAQTVTQPQHAAGALGTGQAAPLGGPRLLVDAPKLAGSFALTGAVLDDIRLKDYHDTISKTSPLVQILGRRGSATPTYVQFGWDAATPGTAVPSDSTVWTASAPVLTPAAPVTLSWNNGAGLLFRLVIAVDDNFMFTVRQQVVNQSASPVRLYPWSRVVRDYTPGDKTSYILHEGPLGVFNNTLKQLSYKTTRNDGANSPGGAAYTETSVGGWLGITDKYWLEALVPEQSESLIGTIRCLPTTLGDGHAYQTDFISAEPLSVAPGATGDFLMRAFTGAKLVDTLDAYAKQDRIPSFDKAIDFGWFYFITKPIFFALDWLNSVLGNFGLAILVFTIGVKLLFFPLANYSYRSMAKMKTVAPKLKAIRDKYPDDAVKAQQETMAIYKAEKINPASGCLPLIVQIPVFFSLYKVIYITIEMRQAPFYGWIHDLSAPDPTNVFNLFGLIPFNPATLSPFLAVGALPLIMGFTMYLQQKLNPAPPDPVQARMFQFMPVMFTFMLARFPAGLVLYWTWNNLLTVGQQWLIMRRAAPPREKPALVKP